MKSLNKVILIGRLTETPVLNSTFAGTKVANFSIETTENRNDGAATHTERHDITAFGKMAEKCAAIGTEGSLIYIEGKMQTKAFGVEDIIVRRSKVLAYAVKFFDIGQESPVNEEAEPPALPQRNMRRRARAANRIIPPFIIRKKTRGDR